jgi:hypothetical protein
MDIKRKDKSNFPKNSNECYYSKIVKNIYNDNKTLLNKIRMSSIKPTDPILHSVDCEKDKTRRSRAGETIETCNNIKNINSSKTIDCKPFNIQSYNESKCTKTETTKNSKPYDRKLLAKSTINDYKTSYSVFFDYDEDNINLSQDFTRKRKSNKKLFPNERISEDDKSPSYYRTRKMDYENNHHKKKSIDMKGHHKNLYKEHITSNSGNVFATKKHFVIFNF